MPPAGLDDFTFRRARAEDAPAIRALIRAVRINPIGLAWQRFLVATAPEGSLAACGQVKPHADGTLELASIAVQPEWRGIGLGRAVIERLLTESPRPLYLTCRSALGPFYQRFGFRSLEVGELPPYFRRVQSLAHAFMGVFRAGEHLLVMKLE